MRLMAKGCSTDTISRPPGVSTRRNSASAGPQSSWHTRPVPRRVSGALGDLAVFARPPGSIALDLRDRGSADAKRKCARSADLARGPGHRRWVVEAEPRDPGEPHFEGDPELHAGQVRAHAPVD